MAKGHTASHAKPSVNNTMSSGVYGYSWFISS